MKIAVSMWIGATLAMTVLVGLVALFGGGVDWWTAVFTVIGVSLVNLVLQISLARLGSSRTRGSTGAS